MAQYEEHKPKAKETAEAQDHKEDQAVAPEMPETPETIAPDAPEPEVATAEEPAAPVDAQGLLAEKKALEERNLRLMAEFDNFRKRTGREKDSIYGDAVANTVKGFLPVLDNFQRAMESACTDEGFKTGMELIYKSFWETMTALGVEEISEVGVEFDPAIHNAVMHIEDKDLGKNTVSQVLQKGYRIGERVLRYAMVQAAN